MATAGVAQAGGDAVDGQEEGPGQGRVGFLAGGGRLALPVEEGDLEVGDRVEVGVADPEGLLEDGAVVEQFAFAGDAQDLGDGAVVFGLDLLEDVPQVFRHEGVDVVAGDPQVGLGQRHLDVGQEVVEEVPLLVHLVEHVVQARLAGGAQAGADAVPAGDDLP